MGGVLISPLTHHGNRIRITASAPRRPHPENLASRRRERCNPSRANESHMRVHENRQPFGLNLEAEMTTGIGPDPPPIPNEKRVKLMFVLLETCVALTLANTNGPGPGDPVFLATVPPLIAVDEFPSGYSLAGCSPVWGHGHMGKTQKELSGIKRRRGPE